MKIEKIIDEAAKLNNEVNTIKKELDKKKTTIKEFCSEQGVTSLDGSKYKAVISLRKKTTFDSEKALAIVKKNKAKWLLKTVVDEEKLEEAIRTGEIDGKLFEDCYSITETPAISFKAR